MILSLALLGIGIAAYSISQLQQHGKLKWSDNGSGFWGLDSDNRKYDLGPNGGRLPSKNNLYTKIFKIKFKEAWFTSTNFTVMLTDSYHALQSISFLSFAGAFSLLSGINFFVMWLGILLVHFTTYRLLQR